MSFTMFLVCHDCAAQIPVPQCEFPCTSHSPIPDPHTLMGVMDGHRASCGARAESNLAPSKPDLDLPVKSLFSEPDFVFTADQIRVIEDLIERRVARLEEQGLTDDQVRAVNDLIEMRLRRLDQHAGRLAEQMKATRNLR